MVLIYSPSNHGSGYKEIRLELFGILYALGHYNFDVDTILVIADNPPDHFKLSQEEFEEFKTQIYDIYPDTTLTSKTIDDYLPHKKNIDKNIQLIKNISNDNIIDSSVDPSQKAEKLRIIYKRIPVKVWLPYDNVLIDELSEIRSLQGIKRVPDSPNNYQLLEYPNLKTIKKMKKDFQSIFSAKQFTLDDYIKKIYNLDLNYLNAESGDYIISHIKNVIKVLPKAVSDFEDELKDAIRFNESVWFFIKKSDEYLSNQLIYYFQTLGNFDTITTQNGKVYKINIGSKFVWISNLSLLPKIEQTELINYVSDKILVVISDSEICKGINKNKFKTILEIPSPGEIQKDKLLAIIYLIIGVHSKNSAIRFSEKLPERFMLKSILNTPENLSIVDEVFSKILTTWVNYKIDCLNDFWFWIDFKLQYEKQVKLTITSEKYKVTSEIELEKLKLFYQTEYPNGENLFIKSWNQWHIRYNDKFSVVEHTMGMYIIFILFFNYKEGNDFIERSALIKIYYGIITKTEGTVSYSDDDLSNEKNSNIAYGKNYTTNDQSEEIDTENLYGVDLDQNEYYEDSDFKSTTSKSSNNNINDATKNAILEYKKHLDMIRKKKDAIRVDPNISEENKNKDINTLSVEMSQIVAGLMHIFRSNKSLDQEGENIRVLLSKNFAKAKEKIREQDAEFAKHLDVLELKTRIEYNPVNSPTWVAKI